MPLSEREKQLLEQLERQLHVDDPQFAESMHEGDARDRTSSGLSLRHLVMGIVIAVLGLGLVLIGVASKLIIVGVLGFVVMAAGVYYATLARPRAASSTSPHRRSRRGGKSSPFMQRLEQQWDERRRQP